MRRIRQLLIKYFKLARFNLHNLYRGSTSIVLAVRVEGESMWPHLTPGKRYLVSGLLAPRVGDFAVFRNPQDPARVFVKRVAGTENGFYRMESAVSWGSSSDDFGVIPRHFILGKVYGAEN